MIVCNDCHFQTRNQYYMKKHKIFHSSNKPFKGNDPKERSENEKCEQSEDQLMSRPLVCGINGCDRQYLLKNSLYSHQKLNHKDPLLICNYPDCHYETRNKYIMKGHKSEHLAKIRLKSNVSEEMSENEMCEQSEDQMNSRPFVCGINGFDKRYSRIKILIDHKRRIHYNPLLVCTQPDCQYKTRDKYLLKKHKLVHSPENQPKIRSLVCGINGCDKDYTLWTSEAKS